MQHKGACLCGAVSFVAQGALSAPDACHCTQCRKQSGHFWASANVPRANLKIGGADKITWCQPSSKVRRGFCSRCGSVLFWDPVEHDFLAIGMGAFETPTGTYLEKHIFVAEKGDYDTIADGLPQKRRISGGDA